MTEDLPLHQVQYGGRTGVILTALALLVLYPALVFFFGWAKLFDHALILSDVEAGIPPGLAIFLVLLGLHESCHGAAFRLAGKKPRYGIIFLRVFPGFYNVALYATASGWMTRRQFMCVGLAPSVVITLAGLALLTVTAFLHYALIVALVGHTCGCVGDWYGLFQIARLPQNALFQDKKDGFEYRLPNLMRGNQ